MKLNNWQTTGTGILALLTILWRIFTTKTVDAADLAGISTAAGLILAKDAKP